MKKHTELFNYRELSPSEAGLFKKEGYLILRNILTAQGLDQMRKESMTAWNGEKKDFDPSGSWLNNSLLVNIHRKSPTIRNYYFEGPLVYIASQTGVFCSCVTRMPMPWKFTMMASQGWAGW